METEKIQEVISILQKMLDEQSKPPLMYSGLKDAVIKSMEQMAIVDFADWIGEAMFSKLEAFGMKQAYEYIGCMDKYNILNAEKLREEILDGIASESIILHDSHNSDDEVVYFEEMDGKMSAMICIDIGIFQFQYFLDK